MEKERQQSVDAPEDTAESKKKRAGRANEIYGETCKESGVKISAWEDFPAWADFVDGKIGEVQLKERAKTELEQFSSTFGKYVVIEKEDLKHAEEDERKKRAKQANKIYRKMCNDAGMTFCFFHDFNTWSQYVEGKLDDTEFAERVKTEMAKLAAPDQTG